MHFYGILKFKGFFIFLLLFLLLIQCETKKGKKGDRCKKDTDCDQNSMIACDRTSKLCDCPSEVFRMQFYYSIDDGTCLSYVGTKCTAIPPKDLPSMKCVLNAICIPGRNPKDHYGICACKKGYYRTIHDQCAKNLPSSSNSNSLTNTENGKGGIQLPQSTKPHSSSNRYPQPYQFSSAHLNFRSNDPLLLIILLTPSMLHNFF